MKKYYYLCCSIALLSMLLGCDRGGDPTPAPGVDTNFLASPESIENFWVDHASRQTWKVSRLTFEDSTVLSELSADPSKVDSTKIVDLYAQLSPCRKDDVYNFSFETGDRVIINFTDRYDDESSRCNPNEPESIDDGLSLNLQGSFTTAEASFKNNTALRQFFDFKRPEGSGTEYRGYHMEWKFEVLSLDSINIEGNFYEGPLPNLKIQFIPEK